MTHPDNGQVEHVVIEGDGWAEYYLRTLPIHPLQQLESLGEKGCRVTMDLMINHELEREILFCICSDRIAGQPGWRVCRECVK